jgi:hypothetical protein
MGFSTENRFYGALTLGLLLVQPQMASGKEVIDGPALSLIKREIQKVRKEWSPSLEKKSPFYELSGSSFRNLKQSDEFKKYDQSVEVIREDAHREFENSFLVPLRKDFEAGSLSRTLPRFSGDVKFSKLDSPVNPKSRAVDGIEILESKEFRYKSGKDALVSSLGAYLKSFSKIEFVTMDLIGSTQQFFGGKQRFVARAVLEIRGLNSNGSRRQDSSDLYFTVSSSNNSFLIEDMTIENLVVATLTRAPAFERVAENAGFDKAKTYTRLEALRRGGYAFAVEDFNNDGKLDAFVGSYGESSLWVGDQKFNFTRVTDEKINSITLAKGAAFVDLDNDGWKDLVISRFSADSLKGDVLIFKNIKGSFQEVKDVFTSSIIRDYAMPMAIADFNNDGLLDIYVGFPGGMDFSSLRPQRKAGMSPHGLFFNKGNFSFKDQTNGMEEFETNLMPHGALASDFNMDGKTDILVIDDQANVGPIYKNSGDGKFHLSKASNHIVNAGYGMGVNTGDFNNDGYLDYVITNATFNSLERVRDRIQKFNEGLRVFMGSKSGEFQEKNFDGLAYSGEGQGGVSVLDYDNDGYQDLYVVNGLWSGSNRDEKLDSEFAVGKHLKLIHQDHMQDGMGDRLPEGGQRDTSSRSIFMKALIQARVKDGKKTDTLSFAGYQRNRLFKNLGDGEFLDVGYLENVDSMADGYMSLVADVDRDGSADLLLRNCDPGTEAMTFPVVEVFKNNHKRKKSLDISLAGSVSNTMGIGAKVYATIQGKKYVREMIANNSAVQGEVVASFGMNDATVADSVEVKWPSGKTDVYKNLSPGRHILKEDSKLTISSR